MALYIPIAVNVTNTTLCKKFANYALKILHFIWCWPACCFFQPCDADSTHTAFKLTKNWSLLFVKQFFILPLHCWDLPVTASEALPWQWIGFPGTNNTRLKFWSIGSDSSTPLALSIHSSLPSCRALLGESFGSSKAGSAFQQSSARFHISNIISGTKLL